MKRQFAFLNFIAKHVRAFLFLNVVLLSASAAEPLTRDAVLAELHPYTGPSKHGVDVSTLTGKVMCGYQGWFNTDGDGAERGWVHWTRRRGTLAPGNAKVDLWPDVSELGPDERFATGFTNSNGKVAEVFSAYKKPTVLRHYEWMRQYGIDGAFVQRFITDLGDPRALRHNNTVLDHCREGANLSGRTYALMYDLSGLRAGRMNSVLEDFHSLRDRMKLFEDPAYLHHRGKPLVAIWGIGFSDRRAYTIAECRELVETLKKEGFSVMLGVPTSWRELTRDALPDPALHDVIKMADVVSPWKVGRYGDIPGVKRDAEKFVVPDIAWCKEQKIDYLPVVFPGFSWHNMTGKTLDQTPRQEGKFLWSQFVATQQAGATMIYVAMFDEVDEGTAIFKCTSDVPPPGESAFVSYGSVPSDFYLRLTGTGAKMLRKEIP
ncbi:MAG: Xylosidase/arabinosidase, partial [Verrucomicrobiales bacterium]|nr:Xylosidase/arabinosidase [Verrucomicrobiales bacterium]